MDNNLVTADELVESLYTHGKICLTVSTMANMDSKYRPFLALFADGAFVVDECAQDDIVLQNMVSEFRIKYNLNKVRGTKYCAPQILKAVYSYAQNFDWYLPQ